MGKNITKWPKIHKVHQYFPKVAYILTSNDIFFSGLAHSAATNYNHNGGIGRRERVNQDFTHYTQEGPGHPQEVSNKV